MYDCEDLIGTLHDQARDHVQLAPIAAAAPVAKMHLGLHFFSARQARVVGCLREDDLTRTLIGGREPFRA